VNFCNQYDVPVFVSVAYNENGFDFRCAEVPHAGSRQEGFVASSRNAAGEVSETTTFGADLTLIQQTLPWGI
jgi:hypothetical protein